MHRQEGKRRTRLRITRVCAPSDSQNTHGKSSATHTVTLFNCHLQVCACLTGTLTGGVFIRIHSVTSSVSQDKEKQKGQRERVIKRKWEQQKGLLPVFKSYRLTKLALTGHYKYYSKQHTQLIIGKIRYLLSIIISFEIKGRERMNESKAEWRVASERTSCTFLCHISMRRGMTDFV